MLPLQQTIQFSDYSDLYDLIIPQDNLLRRINDLVDFSFIQKELMDKYCQDNGRMAESPVMMFKYLLLKTIYDISDVDVVERSRYDMSFKYFLGMTPENTDIINPSSLCKFRKLRLKDKDLLNLLIGKTVEIAIEKGIIKSRTIIVDATHTGSRSNPYSPVEILRLRSKQLRKSLYESDESVKDSLPKKNTDDELEHELDYTKALLDVVGSKPTLAEVPKVKERLNMLKEVLVRHRGPLCDIERRGCKNRSQKRGRCFLRLQDAYRNERRTYHNRGHSHIGGERGRAATERTG